MCIANMLGRNSLLHDIQSRRDPVAGFFTFRLLQLKRFIYFIEN